jgi:phosphatidylserine/phosphatidylglycerophosphate/cardiolipin synthase-like enzyme
MRCHHEKIVIIDDTVASSAAQSAPPSRGSIGWHDVATQLQGPIVGDVANHFRQRWQEAAAQTLPVPVAPAPAGEVTLQLLRTVPGRTYNFCAHGHHPGLPGFSALLTQHHTRSGLSHVSAAHPPRDDSHLR